MHDVGLDEEDHGRQHFVLQQKTDLNEAAATGQIDTPLLLSVILIIDLHIADAIKQQRDQEVLVLSNEVQDLTLFLKTPNLNLSDCRPEFNALRTDLWLILLGNMRSELTHARDIGAHLLVLLPGNFYQALHSRLADSNIARAHGLIKNLVHNEVTLNLVLEVDGGIRDRVVESFNGEATGFNLSLILANVVGQGQHNLVFQLLSQVFRRQLLANVANGCEGCQPNL